MMRIHRRAAVCLAVLGTSMPLTACHSWNQQYPVDSVPLVQYTKPVRLTLHDGSRIELTSARISGDSVHGALRKQTTGLPRSFVSLPMRDVRRLEERQFSAGKTSGVAGATGVALLAAAIWAIETLDFSGKSLCCD